MGKLHELLAVEKDTTANAKARYAETMTKLEKVDHYYSGHTRILQMIALNPQNAALEAAAKVNKEVPTTVYDTFDYFGHIWSDAEDVRYQRDRTNMAAKADVMLHGAVFLKDVPADYLMGLEARLPDLRALLAKIPTLDASTKWEKDASQGEFIWRTAQPVVTVKTEKLIDAKVLYAATDKHPAQVKEYTKDEPVGAFTDTKFSGAITTAAKADMLTAVDELIKEVKRARARANDIEHVTDRAGWTIFSMLLGFMK